MIFSRTGTDKYITGSDMGRGTVFVHLPVYPLNTHPIHRRTVFSGNKHGKTVAILRVFCIYEGKAVCIAPFPPGQDPLNIPFILENTLFTE
jgi:hypothetical protein